MTTAPVSSGPNKLLIAVIVIGGVLVVGVVAIIFLLIGQNSGPNATNAGGTTAAPTGSPSPLVTQTATAAPATTSQPAPDTSVHFTSFDYNPNVACDPTGQEEKPSPTISWSSANAVTVYWTPNNQEADANNGYQVGSSGNQDDMSTSKGPGERYEFPCNHRGTFDTTITLVGADGKTVSKSVTFTDTNWTGN